MIKQCCNIVIFGKDTTEKQLQIGKSVISSISAATSLGCILDSKLNMSQHVSRVCKSATSTHSSHGTAGLLQCSPLWCKRGRNKTT